MIKTVVASMVLSICVAVPSSNLGWAAVATYQAGDPQLTKEDKLLVTFKNGTTKEIPVKVTSGDTAIGKAIKIQEACGGGCTRNGDTVSFPPHVRSVELKEDNSKQKEQRLKGGAVKEFKDRSPGQGKVDFHFQPSGLGFDGLPSIFSASLGFTLGGVEHFADSELTFPQLPSATLDAILTATFDQLSADLAQAFQGGLHLDLANEAITFDVPALSTEFFVSSYSSDLSTVSSLGITFNAPEPHVQPLLLIGALIMVYATRSARNRRRRFD